jgi:hypothetical protein
MVQLPFRHWTDASMFTMSRDRMPGIQGEHKIMPVGFEAKEQ